MAQTKILVVEDDAPIRRGLCDALRYAGYAVEECPTGDAALATACAASPDLLLLDVVLPGKNGFEILRELRGSHPQLPVIMLTARGTEEDRVRGLKLGADDYVVKPFSATELLARVEAVLRRSAERPSDLRELQLADRTVHLELGRVLLPNGDGHRLSDLETRLLRYLAVNRGRPVDRKELLQRVWGGNAREMETRAVDMHVRRLREKIEQDAANPTLIVTVRGKGYMLARGAVVSRAARWWVVFGACNVVVALALIWTTRVVVDLERRELRARAETDYQQSLRLAMWRMDSWLAVLFAREAARPSTDYLSPDLESDYIELRFEIDADGRVASAQETLDAYRGHLDPAAVHAAISGADSLVDTKLADPEQDPSQLVKTQNEFDARVACAVPRPPGEDLAGRQVVVWLDPPAPASEPALAFLRRTESDGGKMVQGFVLDWPRLHDRLLLEIRDLFPDARLERVAANGAGRPSGSRTGQHPGDDRRGAAQPAVQATRVHRRIRTALAVAWLAAIVAAVAVGATLRKSIDLGERRRRFVSAVTHELRTPLTTFQMYSEMLADGLVTTEDQRRQYLLTLKDESQRLSAMVANVLTHARLEERGGSRRFESMNLNAVAHASEAAARASRRVDADGARGRDRRPGRHPAVRGCGGHRSDPRQPRG